MALGHQHGLQRTNTVTRCRSAALSPSLLTTASVRLALQKGGTERLPKALRGPASLSLHLQCQALLTTPNAQQNTSYHSGSQTRNALACKAAAPAPQTSASGPPLFLVSSWQRCADCVPGWEKASGEGQNPASIGWTGGGRAQHRKSLPHAHIGRRHFVSVCFPGEEPPFGDTL